MSGYVRNKRLDKQLNEWCLEQKTSGDTTIFDELLYQRACEIAKQVKEEPLDMYAFLQEFKKRHAIALQSVHWYGNVKYIKLDKELNKWCQKQKTSGDTIIKELFDQKAYKIAKDVKEQPADMYAFLQKFKKRHDIVLESQNTEILQNPVQRDDKANQSDAEKFNQEFSQRLEKENINRDNIYIMIETNVIWKTFVEVLLAHADKTKITIQQIHDLKKKISTVIFCTNITGSHKLPPYPDKLVHEYENHGVLQHWKNKLLVAYQLQEAKSFASWYSNMFKKLVKQYQETKNITGKVLLLIDHYTNRILSEEITQDDGFEVLFLPTDTVSFFKPLCSKFIEKINQVCLTYIERLQNFSSEDKEFNMSWNLHSCKKMICNSWEDIAAENIEELWRTYLKQGRQTRDGTSILTSVSSQELVNSTGKDEIPVMHTSSAEVEKKKHQEQEKNTGGAENTREGRKRRHSKISVVNSEEKINISEVDFKQMKASNEISNEVLSSDGE
ncbi:jerky-like protein, partial [Lasius niger]